MFSPNEFELVLYRKHTAYRFGADLPLNAGQHSWVYYSNDVFFVEYVPKKLYLVVEFSCTILLNFSLYCNAK